MFYYTNTKQCFILFNFNVIANDELHNAYNLAFLAANNELHKNETDDCMSGTSAITVLVIGETLYVANVCDSRVMLAIKYENKIVAGDLSSDQTPFRRDEYERVKFCGARLLSVDQVEGHKDSNIQIWVLIAVYI
ncbi:putative protein phosphatase 2C [Trifolium repens]|nr:putative protein phosphatase 2C [Trifolium repens]